MFTVRSKAKAMPIMLLLTFPLLLVALSALIPQVAAATQITFISPVEGTVGTVVRVQGTISTLGGWYNITWVYPNGTKKPEPLVYDKLPENVLQVDVNITVPEAPAGDNHIELWDIHLKEVGAARFVVKTAYFIEAIIPPRPLQLQEGDNVAIRANITGGINYTTYRANVTVTDPAGEVYWDIIDITTNSLGSGWNITIYPATNIVNETLGTSSSTPGTVDTFYFDYTPVKNGSETVYSYPGQIVIEPGNYTYVTDPAGNIIGINLTSAAPFNGTTITADYTWLNFGAEAHTNYTGTYDIAFNGTLATLATGSFFIGLTNATEYTRFETVNIRATGYIPGQNVTVNIVDETGASVVGYPKVINATDGTISHDWPIPKGISLGTYNVTVTNATGSYPKPVPDEQTFDIIGLGVLTVTEVTPPLSSVTPPLSSVQRTRTVTWKFNITYPDGTLYNVTDFAEITVGIYYNTTFVAHISVTTADCNLTTAVWTVEWKIPKDQPIGINYTFTVLANAISDIYGNRGPETNYASTSFEVEYAELSVSIVEVYPETGYSYNRTTHAYVKFNITYPDNTLFTAGDLGTIIVSVNTTGIPYVANISLSAEDYDEATELWTAAWKIPWNASVIDYNFTIYKTTTIEDKYGNYLPEDATSPSFHVEPSALTVTAIYTHRDTYERGYRVIIYFTATYPDGSPVTTGNATVTITDPENITYTVNATYNPPNARFEATYELSATAPYGTWNVTLGVNALTDGASPPNSGPLQPVSTTFRVLQIMEIQVTITAGQIHFRGEIAEFYIQTAAMGELIDIDIFEVSKLYKPDGTTVPIAPTRIDTGVYKATYLILGTDPAGTYALSVQVCKTTPVMRAHGSSIASFQVSETLSGWDASITKIESDIATVIVPTLGEIQLNLTAISAKLEMIDGRVATINSTLGLIKTDISNINAQLISLNETTATINSTLSLIKTNITDIHLKVVGIDWETKIATIQTTLGTIKGYVEDVDDGGLATINTDLGTLQTNISHILEVGVPIDFTPVWIAVAFSILAFIAAIAIIIMLRRKLA